MTPSDAKKLPNDMLLREYEARVEICLKDGSRGQWLRASDDAAVLRDEIFRRMEKTVSAK